MIKVFNSKSEYDVFTSNGTKLQSGDIYYIVEDSSYHFFTNNITGSAQVVDTYANVSGGIIPSGNLNISTNGSNIDVAEYATVAVSVPASAVVSGNLEISTNGSNINVTDYASVDVNVPIPDGYVVPSGTLSISANGNSDVTVSVPVPDGYLIPSGNLSISTNSSSIDVAQYESVSVSVPASAVVSGTKTITSNGTGIDVTNYASVDVSVSGGGGPQWETVQADGSGNAYIPCAENDVFYYESTEYMGDPYMFMNSSKTPIGEGYNAAVVNCSPKQDLNAKSWIVCVKDANGFGIDFSSCAYALVMTTANATIRYKKISV